MMIDIRIFNGKMQNKLFLSLYTILIFSILSGFLSCSKLQEALNGDPDDNDSVVPVSGTVELPANSTISTAGWKVNSGFVEGVLSGKKYSVSEASSDFGLLFASDKNDITRLMGIVYPGQTDHRINSASTVLAMLMKMPVVNSLNSEGQFKLFKAIKDHPLFKETVLEFESAFLQNKPLFDTTNKILNGKLSALFESAALQNKSSLKNSNLEIYPHVNIITAGRNIAIQNPGYAISHYVGIYKDGVRVDSFAIDPYQFYFGSVFEYLASFGNSPNIKEKIVELKGDGNFEIKVRTGQLASGIDDYESRQALIENISNAALANIGFLLKKIPFYTLNNDCIKELKGFTIDNASAYTSLLSQTNSSGYSLSAIIAQVGTSALDLVVKSQKCKTDPSQYSFLGKAAQFLKWLDVVSLSGNVMNQGNFIKSYNTAPAAFDTCFKIQGNTISTCSGICKETGTFTDPRDGTVYRTVKIGNQVWMAENLKYLPVVNPVTKPEYPDSNPSPIPSVEDDITTKYYYVYDYNGSNLMEAKSSANYQKYGALYNFAAANEACPPGWHLPDYDEWMELAEFISETNNFKGEGIAGNGGIYWDGVGELLKNNDCFSALLGGLRMRWEERTLYMGEYGGWWTSTTGNFGSFGIYEKDDIRTCKDVYIHSSTKLLFITASFKNGLGYSIRCVKD